MLRSSTTSFYQQDGLGSVTSLSNGSGALVQTYTFDSFGKQTASAGSLVNPFQYTGRESDSETSLYYYRARYYDQSDGRFLSEDPASFLSGGVNFYEYVQNSPLGFTDPNGLQAQPSKPCCDDKKMKDGLRRLQQAFSGATADKSKIFQKYKPCLQKLAGDLQVNCGAPLPGQPRTCGYHSDYSPSSVTLTPNGSRGLGGCPGAMATLAHEMVHSCYQSGFNYPDLSPYGQEKEAYGITCQIWGIQCECARNLKLCEPELKKP